MPDEREHPGFFGHSRAARRLTTILLVIDGVGNDEHIQSTPCSFGYAHVLHKRHFAARFSVRQSVFTLFYALLILLASLAYLPTRSAAPWDLVCMCPSHIQSILLR